MSVKFYGDDDREKEATHEELPEEEEFEYEEPEEEEGSEEEGERERYLTKEEVNEIVQNRLARDRKKRDQELGEKLGVSPEEAREYIEAAKSVSAASGLTPAQIRERIAQARSQQAPQGQHQHQSLPSESDIQREIRELKSIVSEEREEKVRQKEAERARKEFGNLFDDYYDDIEDKASDLGLSLEDAAAIVLRPKLRDHYEKRTEARRKNKKKHRVDSTSEGAEAEIDVSARLTPEEREIADSMGVSYTDYYKYKTPE